MKIRRTPVVAGAYDHIKKGATPKTVIEMLEHMIHEAATALRISTSYGRISVANRVNDKYHTNYSLYQGYWDTGKKIAILKNLGAKYIRPRPDGSVEFYYDPDKLAEQRVALVEKSESDYKSARSAYAEELQTEDIEQYKPTKAILDKLQAYRLKGSKVNVRAIKDIKKLLTYLYGAVMMGWDDLRYDCEEAIPEDMKRLKDAILVRAEQDAAYQDNRDKRTYNTAQKFSTVTKFLYEHNIGYKFESRTPTYSECALDRRNGACWTLGYTLVLDDGTSIKFCDHSNEGGGSYGYSLEGGPMISKKEVEQHIINRINLLYTFPNSQPDEASDVTYL